MDDTNLTPPPSLAEIEQATKELGFGMASARRTCALLRTLAASKPGGRLLELGTGTGLSTAWILDGMDATASLESMDNAGDAQAVAGKYLDHDQRLTLHLTDGDEFIKSLNTQARRFDFIFADTWPGKLRLLDETLGLLNPGAFYIVDDMLPQPSWETLDLEYDHTAAIKDLATVLGNHNSLHVTQLGWDTGILIAVKKLVQNSGDSGSVDLTRN